MQECLPINNAYLGIVAARSARFESNGEVHLMGCIVLLSQYLIALEMLSAYRLKECRHKISRVVVIVGIAGFQLPDLVRLGLQRGRKTGESHFAEMIKRTQVE